MMRHLQFLIALVLLSLSQFSSAAMVNWYQLDSNNQATLRVDLFIVSTCQHCQQADQFFTDFARTNPWINVYQHVINDDKQALLLFNDYIQKETMHDLSVPAAFFCDSHWTGFSPAVSGKNLAQALMYCREQIHKQQHLSQETVSTLRQMATSYWLAGGIDESQSDTKVLVILSLLMAASYCSVLAILTLFALLLSGTTWRQRTIISLAFAAVLVIGNFLQQVILIDTLGHGRLFHGLAILTGLLLLGYLIYREKEEKTLFPLLVVLSMLLAFLLQRAQLTCSPNFSLVFQQVILSKTPATTIRSAFAYSLLYGLSVAVFAYLLRVILCRIKGGRWKPFFSYFAINLLGLMAVVLMMSPKWLSWWLVQVAILVLALLIAAFQKKRLDA